MPLETYEDSESNYDVNSSIECDKFDDETTGDDGEDE